MTMGGGGKIQMGDGIPLDAVSTSLKDDEFWLKTLNI
jgi:hypothetical protein